MRHRVAGRKLGRTTEHRIALLRNLSTQLFANEKIHTTLAKAKELRPFAERLVTISKRGTLHARRHVMRHIQDRTVVSKLFDTLSARYDQRPGGYTRIIKLGARRGDNAEMAVIEFVGSEPQEAPAAPKKAKRAKRAKPAKKASADVAAGGPKAKTAKKTTKKTTKKKASSKSAPKTTASKGEPAKIKAPSRKGSS